MFQHFDSRQRHRGSGVRIVGLPGGVFGRLLALFVVVGVAVLAVSFSLLLLALLFVAGVIIWLYFAVRRGLSSGRAAAARRPRSDAAAGRVIEGQVLGREAEAAGDGGEAGRDQGGDRGAR
jgi:hypothetical protein